jgi:hypothetical protein
VTELPVIRHGAGGARSDVVCGYLQSDPAAPWVDAMHPAGELLRSTDLGVAAVARRVGHDVEEAFSRAFERHHGQPPSSGRTAPP